MDSDNNRLISRSTRMKPRVNSAPEVLMVNFKKPRQKRLKKQTKKQEHDFKLSKNSLTTNQPQCYLTENSLPNDCENYLNISRNISIVSGKRLSVLEQNKEKFEVQFCRINVLLISMQLGLGFSMSGLGVYLRSVSPSLSWKDCSYWAALPLLFSGAFGLYFCLPDYEIYRRSHISRIVKIICTTLSVLTAGLTLTASVMSGSHGKWISDFSSTCDEHFIIEHSEMREYPEKCCVDKNLANIPKHQLAPRNETSCICKTAPNGNFSLLKFEKEYVALTCRYVFSALKDYFILQSSLMGVATGVCVWIIVIHLRSDRDHSLSPSREMRYKEASGMSESPSPSFLRFLPGPNNQPYLNNLLPPMPNDLQIPRVIVHEIIDDNEIKPYQFY